jgi:hypothetical protein
VFLTTKRTKKGPLTNIQASFVSLVLLCEVHFLRVFSAISAISCSTGGR